MRSNEPAGAPDARTWAERAKTDSTLRSFVDAEITRARIESAAAHFDERWRRVGAFVDAEIERAAIDLDTEAHLRRVATFVDAELARAAIELDTSRFNEAHWRRVAEELQARLEARQLRLSAASPGAAVKP